MTRTLKDYRPQHDEDCAARMWSNNPTPRNPKCSCGLDALLDSPLSVGAGVEQAKEAIIAAAEAMRDGVGYRVGMLEVAIDALIAALRQSAGTWQPIETAPKDGTWVLLLHRGESVVIGEWVNYGHRACWEDNGEGFELEPTHWMPLPAAPSPASDPTEA